jgi:two-component system, OmpR family, alkaline phosphatase synthesis response regulator PhoP
VLISRIGAMFRRIRVGVPKAPEKSSDILEYEDIKIDRERFMVIHKGRELMLPKKEFELLSLLVSKPDKVFTREDIFGRIWESNAIVGERTIDVHIRKLREKLGEGYISTVKGVGYKFSRP